MQFKHQLIVHLDEHSRSSWQKELVAAVHGNSYHIRASPLDDMIRPNVSGKGNFVVDVGKMISTPEPVG